MILAGDIGGTNTRLGLFEADGNKPRPMAIETYPSPDFPSLADILRNSPHLRWAPFTRRVSVCRDP